MESNCGYDTGIESEESDEKMGELFLAIINRDSERFLQIFSKLSLSSLELELPKLINETTKEIMKINSRVSTSWYHRREVLIMKTILVCLLRMLTKDVFERLLQMMYELHCRSEIFFVTCEYGIYSALCVMLNNKEISRDLQFSLIEGVRTNVYSSKFSPCILDLIIKTDKDNLLHWDDVLDITMKLSRNIAKQKVLKMLQSKKNIGYRTTGRIFHYSCRYNWKECLTFDILQDLKWADLKMEMEYCFTTKNREEVGSLVLQIANKLKPSFKTKIIDRMDDSMENVISNYFSFARDQRNIHNKYDHRSILQAHNEIYLCDQRIQYTEECVFDRNKRLTFDFTESFDVSSVTICGKCKERFCTQNLSFIRQSFQTQHCLLTKRFNQEMFKAAVLEDNIFLVTILWKFEWRRKVINDLKDYQPFDMPHEIVRDFSNVSCGMQQLLRDIYCHDFMMTHREEFYYVDLSIKKVEDVDLKKQREELFIVAAYGERSLTTPTFGGIPVLWKSLTEITRSSNLRIGDNLSFLRNKAFPHYLKEKLLKQHRNLTILSVSTRRELGNEVLDMKHPNYCVVLYCWAKGYVPVGQKEFPRYIGHLRTITDVREGYCSFAAGNKIFPGGCIYRKENREKKVGTFGGFLEKNGETYGITCAHVLLKEHELTESIYDRELQVHSGESELPIGSLLCHAFEYDRFQDVSVDAALIKLHSNVEMDHTFPRVDVDSLSKAGFCDKPPVYNEGTTISVDEEHRNWVLKYGITTGLTYGYMDISKGTCARINRKIKLPSSHDFQFVGEEMDTDDSRNDGYMMFNQTEVYGIRGEPFFKLGDSGSLVFKIMEGDILRCLGLAIAFTSYGSALVTPIDNVLRNLNAKCPSASNQDGELRMKRFKRDVQNAPRENNGNALMTALLSQMQQLQSNIGDNMTRIEAKIDTKFSAVEQKMEEKFVTVENELQNIKTYIFPQVSTSPDTHREESSDDDL